MQSSTALAQALIGARNLPSGLPSIKSRSLEARAYEQLKPYPIFYFIDWKTEDRGPLPRCLPLVKAITWRGARWLFGKTPQIVVAGNSKLEEFLRAMWIKNRMPARAVAMARSGALDGGVVLKYAYDDAAKTPLSIQTLSLVDECRLYYNPHNRDELLMARVQYPYFDAAEGKTYFYREEWTAEEQVVYKPLDQELMAIGTGGVQDPDTFDGWIEESREPNVFGRIPMTHIRNVETDDTWGSGDLWDLFRVFDRVNLTYHLMDRSNQFDSEVNPLYIDLNVNEADVNRPLEPGQPLDLKSDNAEGGGKGDVKFPPTGNALRPAMMDYAKDLRKQIMDAASTIFIDQHEFSNKGNLTTAVLEQLYQPLIELTLEKRKTYGDNGVIEFFKNVALGLAEAGVSDFAVNESDEDSYTAQLKWQPFFDLSQDERTAAMGRVQEEETAGYVTHDRAIEEVALIEGREDVAALKEELAAEPKPSPTETLGGGEQDASLDEMEKTIQGLTRVAGKGAE